jgi:hypothetical protein
MSKKSLYILIAAMMVFHMITSTKITNQIEELSQKIEKCNYIDE